MSYESGPFPGQSYRKWLAEREEARDRESVRDYVVRHAGGIQPSFSEQMRESGRKWGAYKEERHLRRKDFAREEYQRRGGTFKSDEHDYDGYSAPTDHDLYVECFRLAEEKIQ
jgi:hypothetical protein